MNVVLDTLPSTVCRGCCGLLSPAITTTGQQFRRLSMPAMMLKDAGDTKDASSTTTMSKRFKEKFTSEDWPACTGMRKAAWRVSHSRSAPKMLRYPWARRATGAATRTEHSRWRASWITRISTCDLPVSSMLRLG